MEENSILEVLTWSVLGAVHRDSITVARRTSSADHLVELTIPLQRLLLGSEDLFAHSFAEHKFPGLLAPLADYEHVSFHRASKER